MYGTNEICHRQRNYDIMSAVDILTTGTYTRLPKIIKSIVPPEPLSPQEQAKTIEQLEDVMRKRIFNAEVVPSEMRANMKIEDACVKFFVENEFEVALTLPGSEPFAMWNIMDLKILVRGSGDAFDGISTSLRDHHVRHIMSIAQEKLVPPVVEAADTGAEASSSAVILPTVQRVENFWPLVNLYEYLHSLCLSLQLEILYTQTIHLLRTRYKDLIKVEWVDEDRSHLRIKFWCLQPTQRFLGRLENLRRSSGKADESNEDLFPQTDLSPGNYIELQIQTPSSSSSATITRHSDITSTVTTPVLANLDETALPEELKQFEQERQEMTKIHPEIIKAFTYGKVMNKTIFLKLRSFVVVPASSITGLESGVGNVEMDAFSDDVLELDPACLNVEAIVLKCAQKQASNLIHQLHTTLLPSTEQSDSTRKRPHTLARVFEESQITLSSPSETPSLTVEYHKGRRLKIEVDTRTGRIVVSENSAGNISSGYSAGQLTTKNGLVGSVDDFADEDSSDAQKLQLLEQGLNTRLGGAVEAVLSLKYDTLISEVETISKYLGLQAFRTLAWKQGELRKLVAVVPPPHPPHLLHHILFLRFPDLENHYLVVAVNGFANNGNTESTSPLTTQFYIWHVHGRPDMSIESVTLVNPNDLVHVPVEPISPISPTKRPRFSLASPLSPTSGMKEPSLHCWESLDVDSLSNVVKVGRSFVFIHTITHTLSQLGIPFSFIIPPDTTPLNVKQIRSILYMSAREPVVVVPNAGFMDGEKNAQEAASLVGSLYLRVENGRLVAKSRVHTSILGDQLDAIRTDEVSFDPQSGVMSITFLDVEGAVVKLLKMWKRVLMVSLLAKELASFGTNKLNRFGMKVVFCNLLELRIVIGKVATLVVSWVCTDSATPIRGRYDVRLLLSPEKHAEQLSKSVSSPPQQQHHPVSVESILAPFRPFIQSSLNKTPKLIPILKDLFHLVPTLSYISDIAHHRNSHDSFIAGVPVISIIPRSLSHIRVYFHPSYAVDIIVREDSVMILDAGYSFCDISRQADAAPEIGIRDATWKYHRRLVLQPIPKFTDYFMEKLMLLLDDMAQSVEDEKKGKKDDMFLLPIPYGLVFSHALAQIVLQRLDAFLSVCSAMVWLESLCSGIKAVVRSQLDIQVYKYTAMTETLQFGVLRQPDGWNIAIKLMKKEEGVSYSNEDTHAIMTVFADKIRKKCNGGFLRRPLRVLADLVSVPASLMNDLISISEISLSAVGIHSFFLIFSLGIMWDE